MVRDLRAVRLIVADIPACYAALGVIHTHWRPSRMNLTITLQRPRITSTNRCTLPSFLMMANLWKCRSARLKCIRTLNMVSLRTGAIKKGPSRMKTFDQQVNWLRSLMEWRQDVDDAQEFVDGMKTDVFQDRVYVFTPRGDIIDLPAGSTPIDFAYHVHTEIGHRCRGAKVNGKLVTLDYTLKTGNQVEILTAKTGGPSRDWLNPNLGLVRTQRARSKIRQWFKCRTASKTCRRDDSFWNVNFAAWPGRH